MPKFLAKFLKLIEVSTSQQDFFDRLPDPIVLLIFNKVRDAKALCLCMSVCKRFDSIIREVDNVSLLPVDPEEEENKCPFPQIYYENEILTLFPSRWEEFKYRVCEFPAKTFKFFSQLTKQPKSFLGNWDSDFNANEFLKPFRNIESLEIKLPSGTRTTTGSIFRWHCNLNFGRPSQNPTTNLLRWKAEFGSRLQSYAMLSASKLLTIDNDVISDGIDSDVVSDGEEAEGYGSPTVEDTHVSGLGSYSCLVEACIWHYMVQQILKDHQTLNNVIVAHESKIGRLTMNCEQVEELKKSEDRSEEVHYLGKKKSKLPATRTKWWHAKELKLPVSGRVMEEATLVVVKPIKEGEEEEEEEEREENMDWVVEAFENGVEEEEKVFGEAVRKLLKKKIVDQFDTGSP